jgi:hypothetical protein
MSAKFWVKLGVLEVTKEGILYPLKNNLFVAGH